MRNLLAVLLLFVGITISSQASEHVDMGTSFSSHVKTVTVYLSAVRTGYYETLDFVQLPYEPSTGTVEETVSNAIEELASKTIFTSQDRAAFFTLRYVADTDLGSSPASPLIASSAEPSVFSPDSDLQIPAGAKNLTLRYGSYFSYLLPDVDEVTIIPVDAAGNEGKPIVTKNGVDDLTCDLAHKAGNGIIYFSNDKVLPGSRRLHLVFKRKDGSSFKIDNQTGDEVPGTPTLSMHIGKEARVLTVKGSGYVIIECSTNLTDWHECTVINAPNSYKDVSSPGKLMFYRVRALED